MSRPRRRPRARRTFLGGALLALATTVTAASAVGAGGSCCRWRHVDRGLLPATYVISLAVDPGRPTTMYAGTIWRGIAKTVDAAARWSPAGPFPLLADGVIPRPPDVMSLAVDPVHRQIVYAGTNFGGVLKSVDGGASWRTANRGLDPPEWSPGKHVYFPVVSLVVDPSAPRTLYAAVAGVGVFVSRDAAGRWRRLAPGLAEPRVESLALVEGPPRVLYAATAGGVFVTTAGGRWRRSGLDGRWLETIAVDEQAPGTLYAGALHEGVFTSRDGGGTWRRANDGLGNRYVRMLLADPRRAGRVYAATYGGVFASSDGGKRWIALNRGLHNRLVQALALTRGRLYAGTLGHGVFVVEPE